jgi:hypothetical protein
MDDNEEFLDISNEMELELDFATACNMMLGKPYHEAVAEARKWVAEAKEPR